jgi:hypothetical protein
MHLFCLVAVMYAPPSCWACVGVDSSLFRRANLRAMLNQWLSGMHRGSEQPAGLEKVGADDLLAI